jgi:hypothetical protein
MRKCSCIYFVLNTIKHCYICRCILISQLYIFFRMRR